MGSCLPITAAIIISFGLLLTVVAVAIPYWEVNDNSMTFNDMIVYHNGLWITCVSYSGGYWECDDYDQFFLYLPRHQQAARGLGVTAILFGATAVLLVALTMAHDSCDPAHYSMRWLRVAGAILSILAGKGILVAASWYGHVLYQDYNFQRLQARGRTQNARGLTMVFGPSLYIAWLGGALYVLGGVVGFCAACSWSDYEDDIRRRAPYVDNVDRTNTVSKSVSVYV